ncbi:MAG: hypothetical protein WA981_05865 [Glaciecola sp.]
MKEIDAKLIQLKLDTVDLAKRCQQISDDDTYKRLLDVIELLEVTHDTFLGKAVPNSTNVLMKGDQKH